MKGYINNIDWVNVSAMRYWSFPSAYKKDRKQEAKELVFSGEYIGALKVDGYYQRVIKDEDGNIFMVARSKSVKGEAIEKHEWVPHLMPYFESLPNGTCLLCECYLPNLEGSQRITTLLGCLKDKCIARQHDVGNLNLYIFDVMAYDGKNLNDTAFIDRITVLNELKHTYQNEYVQYATYYEGKDLWERIQIYLADGREGAVIMRKDAIVYNKRTPARVSLKIKRELQDTIDCFFTGRYSAPTKEYTGKEIETWPYWINAVTNERITDMSTSELIKSGIFIPVTKPYYNKWAGSLEIAVIKDGKMYPIGWLSGLTDEVKAHPDKYKGRCIEVSAMQWTPDGALRHGKMIGFRDDLNYLDCTWEKINA